MRSICGISLHFIWERTQTFSSIPAERWSLISIHIDVINSAAPLYGFIKWWNEFMWVLSVAASHARSRRLGMEANIKSETEREAVEVHCKSISRCCELCTISRCSTEMRHEKDSQKQKKKISSRREVVMHAVEARSTCRVDEIKSKLSFVLLSPYGVVHADDELLTLKLFLPHRKNFFYLLCMMMEEQLKGLLKRTVNASKSIKCR